MRQTVLLVIMLQSIGLTAARPQEIAPPPLDEEISKQQEIFHRRGAGVPRGYITDRGIADYAELLPGSFCTTLSQLGSSDRWLDIGAGAGQAILDYYAPEQTAAPTQRCGGTGARAAAVALSIEDRQTEQWRKRAAGLAPDRLRYLSGRRLRQYSAEELGKFQLITDVFGGLTYTEDMSQLVDKVLNSLAVGGAFYTLLPGVHLEGGDRLGTWYLTELESATGRREKVCSWLKQTTCVQVTCESKRDWKRPTELIEIRKVCSATSVTPMKLLEFEAGYPPTRRFQLER